MQAVRRMQILTVLEHSRSAAQTKNLETGATYAKTKRIRGVRTIRFRSLRKLKKQLQLLAAETSSCVIRGLLRSNAVEPLRRRKSHFDDSPQRWVMLDVDNIKLPRGLRTRTYTDSHALHAIARLPAEFQSVDCVWQASASAGVNCKQLKMHLWFLLDQPLTAAQLRAWLRTCNAIDPSTLRCVQPHYTAAPLGAEGVYSGPRVGLIRGEFRRVAVGDFAPVTEHSASVDMPPRPAGSANVSRATVQRMRATALKRAQTELDNCSVAYQTAYSIGAILGPAVALEVWNDAEHGHETWEASADAAAARWGGLVASIPGASHSDDFYGNRVKQGIVWGVARERERRGAQTQKALDAAISSTKVLRERLVRRLQASPGSESVLKQVGYELGRYAAHVDKAALVASLQEASGFSEQQVTEALDAGADVEVPADAWREDLVLTGKHSEEVAACDSNLLFIFERYPAFVTGFRVNLRTRQLEALAGNVLELEPGNVDFETLPGLLVKWLSTIGCAKVGLNNALQAFRACMYLFDAYDPFLEEYPEALFESEIAAATLKKLVPVLDKWLITHFGAKDKEYTRLVASKTLIAAVARAVKPGSQVDTMLVLQGDQGIGKTQVLRKLASVIEHGYQEMLDMRDKDSLITMNDGLLVEVSELRALRYTHEETAKAFFSRQRDRIRAPYARTAQDFDRRVVFVGTTNDAEFLSDHQNRRYWPVACRTICRMTRAQADALWREAALRYAVGEQWWLEGHEQKLQRVAAATFRDIDIVEEKLQTWLESKTQVTLSEVLTLLFEDKASQLSNTKRVTRALRALGWRVRLSGAERVRVWVPSA